MTSPLSSFIASIEAGAEPPEAAPLRALWLEARGDWEGAHKRVDVRDDNDSMWVHAYLHRKEGDLWNARYWYARAGRTPQDCPMEEEWRAIATELLAAFP